MLKVALAGALLALLIVSPAQARISGGTAGSWPTPPRETFPRIESAGPGLARQVDQLHDRVDRARESGTISRQEARQFRREARLIDRLGYRYGDDGLSASENAELQNRIHYLNSALYAAGGRSSNAPARKRR
jgi:hypothetical protein